MLPHPGSSANLFKGGPYPTSSGAPLGRLLHQGKKYLGRRGLEEALLEAEVLLMHVMGVSRPYLYAHREEPAGMAVAEAYRHLLERRAQHEPLAYITGSQEFFGLDFRVDQRVLVPRPETEVLVEECLRLAAKSGSRAPLLADIGTGCGAIAIALACRLPEAQVYATDISAGALQVASHNCLRHDVQDRVHLLKGDLLEPLPEPTDFILANLPYIPSPVLATLAPEIALYEPKEALDGGQDGLDLIRGLLSQASSRLRPGGRVLLEIGADQAAAVVGEASLALPGATARVVRDWAEQDRVVVIELAP